MEEHSVPIWKTFIEDDINAVKKAMLDCCVQKNDIMETMMRDAILPFGKMIRPSIGILSYYATGGKSRETIRDFATSCELLHTCTLVHDDINDRSLYRRGKPTLFHKYGAKRSLVIGDILLVSSFNFMKRNMDTYIESASELAFRMTGSEFDQFDNKHNLKVTHDQYIDVIYGKTAMFFSMCGKMGASLSDAHKSEIEALEKFGMLYGLGFQIIDDIVDLVGDPFKSGKSTNADLKSGTMTLPIIMSFKDPVYGEIIQSKIRSNEDYAKITDLIRMTDSVFECSNIAIDYINRAIDSLDGLSDSVYKDCLIGLALDSNSSVVGYSENW